MAEADPVHLLDVVPAASPRDHGGCEGANGKPDVSIWDTGKPSFYPGKREMLLPVNHFNLYLAGKGLQ